MSNTITFKIPQPVTVDFGGGTLTLAGKPYTSITVSPLTYAQECQITLDANKHNDEAAKQIAYVNGTLKAMTGLNDLEVSGLPAQLVEKIPSFFTEDNQETNSSESGSNESSSQ